MVWTFIKAALGGWKAYALIAVAVAALSGGAYVKGRVDGSAICDGRVTDLKADYAAARDKAVAEAEARRAAVARRYLEIDTRYTKEMADAQDDLDRLRRDVAAGKRRLRFAAARPVVPPAAGSSGVDPAAAPELGPDAREAYYDLRRQHGQVTRQLLACQALLVGERQ